MIEEDRCEEARSRGDLGHRPLGRGPLDRARPAPVCELELGHPERRFGAGRNEGGSGLGLEDFRHQIAQQILECDEPRGPTVLVEHDREVAPAPLHLEHEVRRPCGRGDGERGVPGDRILGLELEEVEGVRDPHHLVG